MQVVTGRMGLQGVGKQGQALELGEKVSSAFAHVATSRCSGQSCPLEGGGSSSDCPS